MLHTMFPLAVVLCVLTPLVYTATRCYPQYNLGCYSSRPMNALPQDPVHVRTAFQVSCRNHTNDAVIAATSSTKDFRKILDGSCFQAERQTKVVVHGFTDNALSGWMGDLRDALLDTDDFNVMLVDWHHGAQFPYVQAVANSLMVARQLARFLTHLILVQGLSPERLHLIGHSLGAQIAGNTASHVITKVARVTGLDPAKPYFHEMDDSRRLDKGDAIFVDVIHTDGEPFTGLKGYGSLRTMGHVDFYPNGGEKQPGCSPPTSAGILNSSNRVCSHVRAILLFTQSVRQSSCHLTSYPCATWRDFDSGLCHQCRQRPCPILGLDASAGLNGSYYLSTSMAEPFCGTDVHMTLHLASSQSHAYGRVFLRTLSDTLHAEELLDFSRGNRHYHSNDTESHLVTTSAIFTPVHSVHVLFDRGTGLSALGTADSLDVAAVQVSRLDSTLSWKLCPTAKDNIGAWTAFTAGACEQL